VTDSQKRISFAFKLYEQAARLVADAAEVSGRDQVRLANRAADVSALAALAFQDGYENYQNALASVGLFSGVPPAGG
jgi:hypothetical protein